MKSNANLYLAWNISVSSGSTCNAAPALAIDNVSITPSVSSVTTAVENVQTNQVPSNQVQSTKVIRNGILFIERDGKIYNALGAEVR